jgi:hypothetical protein
VAQRWSFPVLGLLFLVSAGCGTTREQAEERRVLVEVGMTGREVVGRIGRPSKVFPLDPAPGVADQTVEVWAYTMKPPPDLDSMAEFTLSAGALVILCVASNGRDTSGFGSLRIRGKPCSFWVGFGPDGKVRGVTNLQAAP